MKRLVVLILSVHVLSSCSTLSSLHYQAFQFTQATGLTANEKITRSGQWVLANDARFYLAANEDIEHYSEQISDKLNSVIRSALSRHFVNIKQSATAQSYEMAVESAAYHSSDYLVYPKVLLWDDRIGTWKELIATVKGEDENNQAVLNGIGLDRSRLQLIIVEAGNGRIVDIADIATKSGLLTFYQDKPDKLLQVAVTDYFTSLANW